MEYLLNGWNKVLFDLCYVNSIRDVTTVNLNPEWLRSPPREGQLYVYAAYLPHGHHDFLLYDPHLKRTFAHEFNLQPNTIDSFVDLPRSRVMKFVPPIPDVWRKWKEDTLEDMTITLATD